MEQKLYSIKHFKTAGSAVVEGKPYLSVDWRKGSLDGLAPDYSVDRNGLEAGSSEVREVREVIPLKIEDGLITEGLRITRLPECKLKVLMFDSFAKEYVMISNSKCVLDHSSPEAFQASHPGRHCTHAPSEAIALRPLLAGDDIALAYTHRAVDPCYLEYVDESEFPNLKEAFVKALDPKRKKSKFVSAGRI